MWLRVDNRVAELFSLDLANDLERRWIINAPNHWESPMILAFALALAAPDSPLDLKLLCTGIGSQDKVSYAADPDHNLRFTDAVIDDVRVDISVNRGRIHIPMVMMPALHGGKDGWFDLHNTLATRDEITASGSINPLNHIKVRLNRLNGGLMLTVLHGQYHGTCRPFTDDTPRAF